MEGHLFALSAFGLLTLVTRSPNDHHPTTSTRLSLSRKFGHFLGFNGDLSANCSPVTINIPILGIIGMERTIDYFEIFTDHKVLKIVK